MAVLGLDEWRSVDAGSADQSVSTTTIGLPLAIAGVAAAAPFPHIRRTVLRRAAHHLRLCSVT